MPKFEKNLWEGIEHFVPGEFSCHCCGVEKLDANFLHRLDEAREIAGVSFKITSGYRCPIHNAQVGSKPTSSHPKGCAADISTIGSRHRFMVLSALIQAGFTRLGIGKDFIHVDSDEDKDPKVAWLY
jgi:uncharacterized protein YcbK (DUF882 family)